MSTSAANTDKSVDATLRARLTPVSGHKASDGRIFESETLALEHEAGIVRVTRVDAFCDEHVCRDMSVSDIAKLLLEHREELLKILA